MSLIRMHAEVNVIYSTNSSHTGTWNKEGQVTGIDDVGIMIRESGKEYFIPWASVIHVTLT